LIFVDKKWLLDRKDGCRPPFNLAELIGFEKESKSSFEQDEIMNIIFFHFSTFLYIFSIFKNKNYKFENKYVEATFEY
jgi:hypothetical protein